VSAMEHTFFVPGTPVPKGSARAFYNKKLGRALIVQDNSEKQKPWASMVSVLAEQSGLRPEEGSCTVTMNFMMPRPKGHYRTNGEVRPAAQGIPHVKKPDLDKLVRCVLDALTGIAYADDSQVVCIQAGKMYVNGDMAGCTVRVQR
jgi:crossover junction endodeoxyribonuclease RusA